MRRLLASFVTTTRHYHLHYTSNNQITFRILQNPKWIIRLYCSNSSKISSNMHSSTLLKKSWSNNIVVANMANNIESSSSTKKMVVIMGATGSGKSKLSIDLATRYFPSSEIINSDKIQVTKGLDITTNKISNSEQRGVVHHLLGEFPCELSPSEFRFIADGRISDIMNRRKIPFIVGGSNSFIYALLANRFKPDLDFFNESIPVPSNELRYHCCFIWVDVSPPVLHQHLDERVDSMMKSGMYEELKEFFQLNGFSGSCSKRRTGLRRAIGVPEMEGYFREIKNCTTVQEKRKLYEQAVNSIKENTWQLAMKQIRKIKRLTESGWDLQRVDATEAFRTAMMSPEKRKITVKEIWETEVVIPSMKIVKHFLLE